MRIIVIQINIFNDEYFIDKIFYKLITALLFRNMLTRADDYYIKYLFFTVCEFSIKYF